MIILVLVFYAGVVWAVPFFCMPYKNTKEFLIWILWEHLIAIGILLFVLWLCWGIKYIKG